MLFWVQREKGNPLFLSASQSCSLAFLLYGTIPTVKPALLGKTGLSRKASAPTALADGCAGAGQLLHDHSLHSDPVLMAGKGRDSLTLHSAGTEHKAKQTPNA